MLQTTQEYIDDYTRRFMLDTRFAPDAIGAALGEHYLETSPLATIANKVVVDSLAAVHMLGDGQGAKCGFLRTQRNIRAVTNKAIAAVREQYPDPETRDDAFLWANAEKAAEAYLMLKWHDTFTLKRREGYTLMDRVRGIAANDPKYRPINMGDTVRDAAMLLSCFTDELTNDAIRKALDVVTVPRNSHAGVTVQLCRGPDAPCGEGLLDTRNGVVIADCQARAWERLDAVVTLKDGTDVTFPVVRDPSEESRFLSDLR